jgi:dTMP kinase
MTKKALFIAFEGIDGSGKSTQVELLANYLNAKGLKVEVTAEPTKGPIGKIIRDIFNHKIEADERVIAGLFVADRLDHILNKSNGILKILEDGISVITDRYYLSSYAYHSVHMPMDWVIASNSMSADLLKPDITFYIDMSVEVSLQRLHQNRASIELYETEENLKNVSKKYDEAIEKIKSSQNIIRIDGNQSVEQISLIIQSEINKYLH